MNEESCCDEKGDNVPEKVMLTKTFMLKELTENFHDTESTKEKMLGADSNLERGMTIH